MICRENGKIVRHPRSFPPVPFDTERKILTTYMLSISKHGVKSDTNL